MRMRLGRKRIVIAFLADPRRERHWGRPLMRWPTVAELADTVRLTA